MSRTIAKKIALLMSSLLVFFLLVLLWFISSQSGLDYAVQFSKKWIPDELSFSKVQGSLIGPISVQQFNYQTDGFDIKAEDLYFQWLLYDLILSNFSIKVFKIKSLNIEINPDNTESNNINDNTNNPLAISLPNIYLPLDFSIGLLNVDNVHIQYSDKNININNLALSADTVDSKINIKFLAVQAQQFEVKIRGDLSLFDNYEHNLNLEWSTQYNANAENNPAQKVSIQGNGKLIGDLNQTTFKQQLKGAVEVNLEANIFDLINKFRWQLELDVAEFNASQLYSRLPELSGSLEFQAQGDFNTATAKGTAKVQHPEYGDFKSNFDLARLDNNQIKINKLSLLANSSATQITLRGDWYLASKGIADLALAVHWKNLRWPLTGEPIVKTQYGNAFITGDINHYHVELATDQPLPEVPDYTLLASLDTKVTSTGLIVKSLKLSGLEDQHLSHKTLTGRVEASGSVMWNPELKWQSTINTYDMNPSRLNKQWPGKINAMITNQGKMINDRLVVSTELQNLNGELRGYPVSGIAELYWQENKLDISLLKFQSGDSILKLQGHYAPVLNLNWDIRSNNLDELYPGATGQFHSNGYLSGALARPVIYLQLEAKNFAVQNYKLGELNVIASLDLFQWQDVDVQLKSSNIELNGFNIESFNINTNKTRLNARLQTAHLLADIELNGQATNEGWMGQVSQATITSQAFNNWQLQSNAKLSVLNKSIIMEPLCWQNAESNICASLQHQQSHWFSTLKFNQLPMSVFNIWFPVGTEIKGLVKGEMSVDYLSPKQPDNTIFDFDEASIRAKANINLTAGTIRYPLFDGEFNEWNYQNATVAFNLDLSGLKYDTKIQINKNDSLTASLLLPKINVLDIDNATQQLRAALKVKMQDLNVIEAFIPEIQGLQGELGLQVSANGTLSEPIIKARARIKNSELKMPQFGLHFTSFKFNAKNFGTEKINFQLETQSGAGALNIQGETLLDAKAIWPTTMTITGSNFEVVRIPVAEVTLTPDIQVSIVNKKVNISGGIDIVSAKIRPKDISKAAKVSPDVVFGNVEVDNKNKWSSKTLLRLNLGDNVDFKGFGFAGRLGGQLLIQDEFVRPTTAEGEISISKGRYTAYGQQLEVEQGRLVYTGGPITNPGLDLSAVRKTGDITAGLKIRGSLLYPKLKVFSKPAMRQADAYSYLLFGTPIDDNSDDEGSLVSKAALLLSLSSGNQLTESLGKSFGFDELRVASSNSGDQASIVIGRYLSPKLYVSYGVGLIDSINTFKVRYDISESWQLVGENGDEQQGADIFYKIDK